MERKETVCVDYRRYPHCRTVLLDDKLHERGMTRWLLLITVIMVLVSMWVCSIVSIFLSTQTKIRLDNLRSFLLQTIVLMALHNDYTNRHALHRLHNFFNNSMDTLRTGMPEEHIILEKSKLAAKSQLSVYMCLLFVNYIVMIVSQPLAEIFSGNDWRKLPYPWDFPPSNTDFAFYMVFVFQSIGLYFSHSLGCVMMSFSAVTVQMTALFDVLLLSIRHIEERAMTLHQQTLIEYQACVLHCLKEDVAHHQQLVSELISATNYLRNTFFIPCVTISMLMACEAYPLIMGTFTPGELVKGVLFLIVQLICWAQMCFRMETMSDQNTAVFDALSQTPWYSSGAKYKKLMLTALTFAERPMYIRSRLFTGLSATMATFYSFVISSFNILSVIRKMN